MIREETRDLVENNLGLIYSFMKKKQIYDLDIFQELALYLCEQTDRYYDESRGKFSTFSYCIMNNYLKSRIYKAKKKIEENESYSLEELAESENVSFYENVIKYDDSVFENIVIDEYLAKIIKDLKPQRKAIVYLWIEGYNDTEVSERLQISKQAVNKFKHSLKNKILEGGVCF